MIKKTFLGATLLILALQTVSIYSQTAHIIPLFVCIGQPIMLKWPPASGDSAIVNHILDKRNGKGKHRLLTKIGDDNFVTTDPRIELKETTLTIGGATEADAGIYEWDVKFNKSSTSRHKKFKVNVNSGCPDFAKFFAPGVSYSTFGKDDMRPLKPEQKIHVSNSTLLALTIIIPKAEPPVTCRIKWQQQDVVAAGSANTTKACTAAIHFEKVGKETISVRLEYTANDDTRSSPRIISVDVSRAPNERLGRSTTKPEIIMPVQDHQDDGKEEDFGTATFGIVISILVILLAISILLLIAWFKYAGPDKGQITGTDAAQDNDNPGDTSNHTADENDEGERHEMDQLQPGADHNQ